MDGWVLICYIFSICTWSYKNLHSNLKLRSKLILPIWKDNNLSLFFSFLFLRMNTYKLIWNVKCKFENKILIILFSVNIYLYPLLKVSVLKKSRVLLTYFMKDWFLWKNCISMSELLFRLFVWNILKRVLHE